MDRVSRRSFLGTAGIVGAAALAGCDSSIKTSDPLVPAVGDRQTIEPATCAEAAELTDDLIPTELDLAAKPAAANADYPPQLEEHCGDPNMQPERLWVDPARLYASVFPGMSRATYEPRLIDFNERILTVAERFIGFTRETHGNEIERMLQLFGFGLRDANGYVAYCAAGVSYVGALAYREQQDPNAEVTHNLVKPLLGEVEKFHFYPTVSVQDMKNVALGTRRWRDESASLEPKPGWLVVFRFRGGTRANHVGIVKSSSAKALTTIEFNTTLPNQTGSQRNGGAVAQRERTRDSTILGYIATDLKPLWGD